MPPYEDPRLVFEQQQAMEKALSQSMDIQKRRQIKGPSNRPVASNFDVMRARQGLDPFGNPMGGSPAPGMPLTPAQPSREMPLAIGGVDPAMWQHSAAHTADAARYSADPSRFRSEPPINNGSVDPRL